MQPVATDKALPFIRNRQAKLEAGYHSVTDIEKQIVRLVAEDWDRLQKSWAGVHWATAGELLDAITAILLEYLIWDVQVAEDAHVNSAVGVWYGGRFNEFGKFGALIIDRKDNVPNIDDFLYVDDFTEFDFSKNATTYHGAKDEEYLADFRSSRAFGFAFVDNSTWSVLAEPKIDVSSFESYQRHMGLRTEWEYEFILDAWRRIKPFTGARLVCRGSHPINIARKVKPELQRFKFRTKLPRSLAWRKNTAKVWRDRLLSLPIAERKQFSRHDLAEALTGSGDVSKPIRNLWDEIKKIAPDDLRKDMAARGPKKPRL